MDGRDDIGRWTRRTTSPSGPTPSDAEDLGRADTARIEQQVRRAQEHAAQVRAWAADVERITGEGRALRGGVRVTVSNTGVLQTLHLSEPALQVGADGLARAILEAIDAAKQVVADETAATAVAQFGTDGEVTRLMVADLGKRLGVTPEPTGSGRGRGDGSHGVLG